MSFNLQNLRNFALDVYIQRRESLFIALTTDSSNRRFLVQMQLILALHFLVNSRHISGFRSSTPSSDRFGVFYFRRANNLVDIQSYLRLDLSLCVLGVQTQLVLVKIDFACSSAIRGCRLLQRFDFFDSVRTFLTFLHSDLFRLIFRLFFLFCLFFFLFLDLVN